MPTELGNELHTLRKRSGLTAAQLAAIISRRLCCACNAVQVYRWEAGTVELKQPKLGGVMTILERAIKAKERLNALYRNIADAIDGR